MSTPEILDPATPASSTPDSWERASAGPELKRITVSTCFGCGAMEWRGTCETGCRERRLDFVRAAAYEELATIAARSVTAITAFRPVAEELATHRPRAPELEAVYRDLQTRAHELLHHHPEGTDEDAVLAQASQPAVTWYCDRCGGIDAPQECLDVCVWRPVDWVPEADYRELRERELAEHGVERRLRVLVRRLAWTTPLPGEWARCSDVLAGDARHALAT